MAKNEANAKQALDAGFLLLESVYVLHPIYHPKILGHILKKKEKEQVGRYSCDCTFNPNENEDKNEK